MGHEAIDRASSLNGAFTRLQGNVVANLDGIIDTVEIWANVDMENVFIGIMHLLSGTTYKCRSATGNMGTVLAGAKRTLTVNLTVVAGDCLAVYFTAGAIDQGGSGGAIARTVDDVNACIVDAETVIDSFPGDVPMSLYASGLSSGGGGFSFISRRRKVENQV